MDKINKWWILEVVFTLLAFISALFTFLTCSLSDDAFLQIVYLRSNYPQDILMSVVFFFFLLFVLFSFLLIPICHYRYRHYGCRYKKCLYRKDSSK